MVRRLGQHHRPWSHRVITAGTLALLLWGDQARASPWSLPQGGIYAYVGTFWTRSHHFFDADAERTEFLNDGTSRVYGLSLEGAYGISDRLMISGALPLLRYRLADDLVTDAGSSFGDTRISLRHRVFEGPFAAALEGGIKFPTAAAKDPTRAQVGEGQYDFEIIGSVGKWFAHRRLAASVDVGYRWRRRNDDTGFRPGDERIFRWELSFDLTPGVSIGALIDAFDGDDGDARVFGMVVPSQTRRRTTRVNPSVTYHLAGSWELSGSASVPLAGRRAYGGKQFVIGVSYNQGLDRLSGLGGFSSPRGTACCSIQ